MAKKETAKYEALVMLQIVGPGHPCTIFSDRIAVQDGVPPHKLADAAYRALAKSIADGAWQKLIEKLPKTPEEPTWVI